MLNHHQSKLALPRFVCDETLARRYNMPLGDFLDLCINGHFVGARYDSRNRRWFIPVPVRISNHD